MGTARLGKLPRIGLRPLVYVYKCDACNRITSIEPERQEERPVTAPIGEPAAAQHDLKSAMATTDRV